MGDRRLGADDVRGAVAAAVDTLRAGRDRDWSVPAGDLGWTCWDTVVHTDDIARGLGLAWRPDDDLCAGVLARLMPEVEIDDAGAWETLLWATGRTALRDRPRRMSWRWHNERS